MTVFGPFVIGISCLKLLLMPTYRSTDFEVHRNWLAVTHSLPLDQWYVDQTSPWTLDYPPLFAWFEFTLAKIAVFFDSAMLDVKNLNYTSPLTVVFQRLSVILTDLVLAYGCKVCGEEVAKLGRDDGKKGIVSGEDLFVILFTNAGLLIVDHIHFQYNGFLFGLLFISIARIVQRREVEAALWFSVLLNLKHIFLYIAPAFFIYLLRSYVLSTSNSNKNLYLGQLQRLVKLGSVVCLVFGLSFGPFIARGQLQQVLARLFPFRRGLCHAYWAPNFWSLYNFADKIMVVGGRWLGWGMAKGDVASMTGGLVQEFSHAALPSVSPMTTLIVTALSIMPGLVVLWRSPNNRWAFIRALVLCGFGSFMFGWHVHEKAILMVILPMGLACLARRGEAQVFMLLSVVGHFSLFPLLFTPQETLIKVTAFLLHALITRKCLRSQWGQQVLGGTIETLYIIGLLPVFILLEVGTKSLGLGESLPFLPLMLISVYCALGVTYCWVKFSYLSVCKSQGFKWKVN